MRQNSPYISIVVPVYGCGKCLKELYQRLQLTLRKLTNDYEIILVNDHSPDQAWSAIEELSKRDPRIKGLKLSRNFGQHVAITCGLDYSQGDWVVVMDCDLQDQPEEILSLHSKALEGYDIVFAQRVNRSDSKFKTYRSKWFYKLYDFLTESKFDSTVANYSIVSRRVVDKILSLREQSRSYPLLLKWIGFNATSIPIRHAERFEGKSSYNLRKLLNFAMDSIVSQSNKPLRLSINFGFLLAILSLFYGLFLIYRYFFLSQPIQGWTSVMVSIYFIGGLLFANLGIVGLYLGKIFDEAKRRPLYIVERAIGVEQTIESKENHEAAMKWHS